MPLMDITMKTLVAFCFFSIAQLAAACCGKRSADIRYEWIGENTYRFNVIVYTCLSDPSDLPQIDMTIDEGEAIIVPRSNITDDPSADLRRSEYIIEQAFPMNGWHTVGAFLGSRGAGVVNIPNSINESTCIRAEVLIDPWINSNSSISFVTPPTQVDRVWNTLVHTPSPFDADGDSIAFELGTPRGQNCSPIMGYQTPQAANFTWLNPADGTFVWDYPNVPGEFNLTIIGTEYRNGQPIGRITRDMSVCVMPFILGMAGSTTELPFAIRPTLALDDLWVDASGRWAIELIDAMGRSVLKAVSDGQGSAIRITEVPAGTYHVIASDNNGMLRTAHFVKLQ